MRVKRTMAEASGGTGLRKLSVVSNFSYALPSCCRHVWACSRQCHAVNSAFPKLQPRYDTILRLVSFPTSLRRFVASANNVHV